MDYVTEKVLAVLNERVDIEEYNKTLISLVPKKDKSSDVKGFWPISLCKTIYKVTSKALVNRLRIHLGSIIDFNQWEDKFLITLLLFLSVCNGCDVGKRSGRPVMQS